jgi:hypothetical protein
MRLRRSQHGDQRDKTDNLHFPNIETLTAPPPESPGPLRKN